MVALYSQPMNETVTYWWEQVTDHADRFFTLSHSFKAEMDDTTIASLMIQMADERDAVSDVKYPTAAINARAHLLDAMAYTILGISATMVQKTDLSRQYLASAREQLNALMSLLDNTAAA